MPFRRLVPALVALVAFTVACDSRIAAPAASEESTAASTSVAAPSAPADPAAVGANELGLVPVLMYHRLVANPQSVYDRTPRDFRAELNRLVREKYVPVTAAELATGDIDIPAGSHPVVLTFDDGDPTQFRLTASGAPAPGTAVSILLDVARLHPEFRPVATFFVNSDPFDDPGGRRTLPWLVEHGMEIGNHTATHANLAQSSAEQVRTEIGTGDQAIRKAAPGTEPATLALPFGARPEPPELALRGPDYEYRGVFLVGANPAPSPFSADFDPVGIPRIRSQGPTGQDAEVCSTAWLDKLAADPAHRYTSDGDPQRISYPRGASTSPATAFQGRVMAY